MTVRKESGAKKLHNEGDAEEGDMRHWGVEETTPISPRHSGTEGKKEVPDVHGTPH